MAILKIQTILRNGTPMQNDHRLAVLIGQAIGKSSNSVGWNSADTDAMVHGIQYAAAYPFKGWVPESLLDALICEFTVEVPESTARKVRALNKLEAGLDLVRRFDLIHRP